VADGGSDTYWSSVTKKRVIEEYLVAYPKVYRNVGINANYNAAKEAYEWTKSSTAFKQDKSLQKKTRPKFIISFGWPTI